MLEKHSLSAILFSLALLAATVACSLSESLPTNFSSASNGGCRHIDGRDAVIDAGGAQSIRIVAQAGLLTVTGQADASQVEVKGTACAAREADLAGIQLVAERRGQEIVIEAIVPENLAPGAGRLDLTVTAPHRLPLTVSDTGGAITIKDHQATLRLTDGSGGIDLQNFGSDVTIDRDGAGEIVMNQVQGRVTITDDGAGPISLQNIGGSIAIGRDGSGSIEIRQTAGSVTIGRDGAGDIILSGIKGNVMIEDDGGGDIDASGISGSFTVRADGSGGISHTNVNGAVSLP